MGGGRVKNIIIELFHPGLRGLSCLKETLDNISAGLSAERLYVYMQYQSEFLIPWSIKHCGKETRTWIVLFCGVTLLLSDSSRQIQSQKDGRGSYASLGLKKSAQLLQYKLSNSSSLFSLVKRVSYRRK